MTSSSPLILEINGQRYELVPADWENLDCIKTDTQSYHLLDQRKAHAITVLDFDFKILTCTLRLDGKIRKVKFLRDLDLMIEKMGLNAIHSKNSGILHAPMPGLVTGIHVTVGQEVEKGLPLLLLEAMKMENVITAPHHSRINALHVAIGQTVEKGTVLIEFDAV